MAENALLRKPLIISRRQVKWLANTKTNHIFLVLLAKVVQTWKQALFLVSEDEATPLAYLKIGDSALQPLLYKGECKEASSSLYPYLSSGKVRSKNSDCRRGDLRGKELYCRLNRLQRSIHTLHTASSLLVDSKTESKSRRRDLKHRVCT